MKVSRASHSFDWVACGQTFFWQERKITGACNEYSHPPSSLGKVALAGEPTRPHLGALRLTQQARASAGGSSRPDLGVLRLTQQARASADRKPRPVLGHL
eukprot:1449190-Amphidinium_carterae.1